MQPVQYLVGQKLKVCAACFTRFISFFLSSREKNRDLRGGCKNARLSLKPNPLLKAEKQPLPIAKLLFWIHLADLQYFNGSVRILCFIFESSFSSGISAESLIAGSLRRSCFRPLSDSWGMKTLRLFCIYCNIHMNTMRNIDSFDV